MEIPCSFCNNIQTKLRQCSRCKLVYYWYMMFLVISPIVYTINKWPLVDPH